MKLNIYIKTALLFTVLCSIGCTSDEDSGIFDQTADERINTALSTYQEELIESENGWKTRFFPDNPKTGGWTFVMKFTADHKVQMIGDVLDNPEVEGGIYKLGNFQGPVINFASYLPITELVNPSSAHPQARYGSNEFIFIKTRENGDIELESKRNHSPMILQAASAGDWEDIKLHAQTENSFIGSSTSSVYRYFTVGDEADSTVYDMSYEPYLRNMTLKNLENSIVQSINKGVAFTKDSVVIAPPVVYEGTSINKMAYNEDDGSFVGEVNGVKARLYYSDVPFNLGDSYLNIPATYNAFSYRDDTLEETKYTSSNFVTLYTEANDRIDSSSDRDLFRIELRFYEGDNASGNGAVRYRYSIGSSNYSAYHYFDYELADGILKLTANSDGWSTGNTTVINGLADLDAFFFNSEGLYVDKVNETFRYTNEVYTFTSVEDPSIRYPTYAAFY